MKPRTEVRTIHEVQQKRTQQMCPGKKRRDLAERTKRNEPLVVLYLLSIWNAIIQMSTIPLSMTYVVQFTLTTQLCGNIQFIFTHCSMLAHTSTLCIVYILYIVYARKRIVHNGIEIEMHQLYTISYSYSVPCHIYASSAERTSDPTNE